MTGEPLSRDPSRSPIIHVMGGGVAVLDPTEVDQRRAFEVGNAIRAWLLSKPSVNTRMAYANDMGLRLTRGGALEARPDGIGWLPFLATFDVGMLDAQRAHVDAWAELQRRGDGTARPVAPRTLARRLSALSSFYQYLRQAGIIDRNPVEFVARPDIDRDHSPTQGLTREQAQLALYAGRQRHGHVGEALVGLLLLVGLRVSEAVGIDVPDLGMDSGHRVADILGKGALEGRVVLPLRLATVVDALLAERAARLRVAVSDLTGPLLIGPAGTALTRDSASDMVEAIGRQAGLPMKLTPHMCRHTFVTLALDAGVPLRDVQDSARHRDPRTTRRYDRARGKLNRSAAYTLASYLED